MGILDSLLGSSPTTQTVQTTAGLSPWSAPYVGSMLTAAQRQVFDVDALGRPTGIVPYLAYGAPVAGSQYRAGMGPGEQAAAQASVAAPTALQQQAAQSAAAMTTPTQYGTATDIGRTAGLGLLETAGQAQGLQNLGMQAVQQGRQFAQDITDPYRTSQFMSPYMQNVVDVQQREAKRQADIAAQTQQAQAARAGAFGGARDIIQRSEANRNLQTQLGNIQAQGLQSAFQNAQQQQLAAQNQAMQGLQTGIQGYGAGIQGQTGAYGQATQSAYGLGALGGQELAAQQNIANLQNTLGQQQQQYQQNIINQAMQNLQNQRMYPQQQLQYLSSMLSGLPVSSTGQVSSIPGPTGMQNLASLGLGAYGLNKMFPTLGSGIASALGFKEGGEVESYADGGSVMSQYNKDKIVGDLHPMGLPRAMQGAMMRGDMRTAQTAQEEMSLDNAIRRGIAAAAPYDIGVGYAHGGIVAFAGDEEDNDPVSGQLVTAYQQGPADPGLVSRAEKDIEELSRFAPTAVDPTQVEVVRKARLDAINKELGEGPYKAFGKSLEEREAARGQMLEEGKGLAALRAAGAILRPGGFMRGLGAAGEAFADSYGKSLEANRLEKQSIAAAQFHLADAQRKERMGLMKEADAAEAAYRGSIDKANKFSLDKLKYQADARVKLAQASRQLRAPGAGGAGKEPKLNEQLAAAEIAFENDPTNANLKRVTALRRAAGLVKTSDIGGGRIAVEEAKLQSAEDAKVVAAMQDAEKKALISREYVEAKTPAEQKAVLAAAKKAAADSARAEFKRGQRKGDGSAPPPPEGFVPQR